MAIINVLLINYLLKLISTNFSLNATEIKNAQFNLNSQESLPTSTGNDHACLYLGHTHPITNNHQLLFHYDLGQLVLTAEGNFTLEHLLLLMHTMDTNVSQLDCFAGHEWSYLNGRVSFTVLENLLSKRKCFVEQIKRSLNVVYHPRSGHNYAIKPVNCQSPLTYVELVANARASQQCTLDIVLERLGGIRQMLMLLAKLVEHESEEFRFNKTKSKRGR